jgi:flavodoxin
LKSLVIYYTRTGNARFVAETIAAEIGADAEEIVDMKNRSGKFAYLTGGSDARRGKTTEIAPTTKSPADYELIVVGTPVWASRPAPAVTTYLKKNDLAGKKVALFFTQGGKKPSAIEQTKALIPNSECIGVLTLIEPLKSKEESEKQIVEWCKTLTAN